MVVAASLGPIGRVLLFFRLVAAFSCVVIACCPAWHGQSLVQYRACDLNKVDGLCKVKELKSRKMLILHALETTQSSGRIAGVRYTW